VIPGVRRAIQQGSKMKVPTEAEWGTPDPADLDVAHARKMFLGKEAADSVSMFSESVLERIEDLQFMPPVPFRYYVFALRDYVLSPQAREQELDASDSASAFLGLIEWRLQEVPDSIAPVIGELLPAVHFVAERQADYAADPAIYGDFRVRADRIKALAGRLTTG
jgi:hypothetical protein